MKRRERETGEKKEYGLSPRNEIEQKGRSNRYSFLATPNRHILMDGPGLSLAEATAYLNDVMPCQDNKLE
ncbi:hypothetical protein TNCV_3330291 [Trichonephila clavipes]|nr:hypothetical protein TNCV_3330291 [Trichonephila clavipes]